MLLLFSSWSFLLFISIPALLLVLFLIPSVLHGGTWSWNDCTLTCMVKESFQFLWVVSCPLLVLFLFKFKCSACFRRTRVMTRLVISELAIGNFWNSRNCSDSVLAALKKMFETDKNNVCCFFRVLFRCAMKWHLLMLCAVLKCCLFLITCKENRFKCLCGQNQVPFKRKSKVM